MLCSISSLPTIFILENLSSPSFWTTDLNSIETKVKKDIKSI